MSDPLERHPSFSVVRRLAVGGMGEVLLTRFCGNAHVTPGLVVVKRTIPDHPNRTHQDQMLREEGRVALRLRHANLVDTFAVDELEDHPLLVMEYLAGRSMAQVLGAAKRKGQPVPVSVALAVLRGSACGLHFAHTLKEGGRPLGLVHRDVSPANIFVTFDGKCKVIDFGVAKADDSEIKTSTGILKGKLGYMSPEHAKGEKLDPRSDLWSLGVVFWEMLVADRLFGGSNPAMTLYSITQGQLDGPSKRRGDVPPDVEALCLRLLTKDREQRVSSGAELVQLIDALPERMRAGADIAEFLAERFPGEAEAGRREAGDLAKLINAAPKPEGLVDGGARGAELDSGNMPTLIVDGQSLYEQAIAAGILQRKEPPPQEVVDEQAKTIAVRLEDVPDMDDVEGLEPDADLLSVVTAQGLKTVPARPMPPIPQAPPPSQPPTSGPHQRPPPHSASGPTVRPAASSSGPIARPQSTPLQHLSGPSLRDPSGPTRAPRPAATPSGPHRAPPQASAPSGPSPRPQEQSGKNRIAAQGQSGENRRQHSAANRRRRRGPSAVAVALSTFGALAVVMGVLFAVIAERRQGDAAPAFVGYAAPEGTDVVVARPEDAPAGAALFQVQIASARLALAAGQPRSTVKAPALERELKRSGVYDRAKLPRTARQRVAAVLPAAITLLGLLSLAFALPGLLLSAGTGQLVLRAMLVLAVLAGGAAVLKLGGLGWPGLDLLEEPPTPPRLVLGQDRGALPKEVPADKQALLAEALATARSALLRGEPQAALDALAPAAKLKDDLAELHALLGAAYHDLGRNNIAEGHFTRYLELRPDAPDAADVTTYLAAVAGK